MKQRLIEFLKALEQACPPINDCHHPLMYARYGSDETGWEDRLLLQVNDHGVFQSFFLDDDDFTKSTDILVSEIVNLLKRKKDEYRLSRHCGMI